MNKPDVLKLKQKLIKYGRELFDEKLVVGSGGNISARMENSIYIKASGASLKNSTPDDYIKVDLKSGRQIDCGRRCSVELPMHLACYKARPDIGAVIHTHPVCATALAAIEEEVPLVSYELAVAMRSKICTIKYIRSGTKNLAKAVADNIKKCNGVLLKNHGALVVGNDLKEAFVRALALERACKIFVISKFAGKVSSIPGIELKKILSE